MHNTSYINIHHSIFKLLFKHTRISPLESFILHNCFTSCDHWWVTVPIDPAVLWTQHRESTSPPRRRGRRSRLVLCFGWPITFLVQSTQSTIHPESMPRGDPQFCFYGDSNRLRRIPDIGSFSIFSQWRDRTFQNTDEYTFIPTTLEGKNGGFKNSNY